MSLIMNFSLIGNIAFQLVLAAIGGIIGGSLTLLANRINARREQIKFSQEWYERQYLTEGIEPLTAYYTVLALILRGRSSERYSVELLPESTEFPVVAYNRLHELFPDNRFAIGVEYIEEQLATFPYSFTELTEAEQFGAFAQLYHVVSEFRDSLIRIGADLRKQIHANVHDKNAHLDSLLASQIFDELFEKKGPLEVENIY